MSNGSPFPFQVNITSLTQNCYETVAQPVCHRQVVVCYVWEDSVHYWCPVHAPSGPAVVEIPEPAIAPVTFPEP